MSGLYGNAVMAPAALKTVIIEDTDGNELTGVVTDSEVTLTATRADVKIGKVFVSNDGIEEGTDTRTYRTTQASRLVLPGEDFSIPLNEYDKYNYTKFQAVIAEFNTTEFDSTSVSKIAINDAIYAVNSTNKLADITKNSFTKSVDFNITNNTNSTYIIYYSTFKEE